MQENINSKISLKDKAINLYFNNKLKIFSLVTIIVLVFFSIILINIQKTKENILISEKYIQAGLYLASGKKDISKEIYEEIIKSKNNIYSILSLNVILEKNLIKDKKKIIEYFNLVEESKISSNQKEVVQFKKALFMLKNSEKDEAKKILKKISKSDSSLRFLADEILKN